MSVDTVLVALFTGSVEVLLLMGTVEALLLISTVEVLLLLRAAVVLEILLEEAEGLVVKNVELEVKVGLELVEF